jgi:hypothetical protein
MNHSTEVIWSEFGQQLKAFIINYVKDDSIAQDILPKAVHMRFFTDDSDGQQKSKNNKSK